MTTSAPKSSSRWLPRVPFWGWALIPLLCLSLIVTAAIPPNYPKGSTYENSLSGYTQWYQFMEAQGHPIKRWQRSYRHLKGTGQTLVQVVVDDQNSHFGLGSPEILNWVEQGNTLVELSWDGTVTGASFSSDLLNSRGAVRIETTRRYKNAKSRDGKQAFDEVLLSDDFGGVIGLKIWKKGELIHINYPLMGAGAYVNQGANFQTLADLATRRKGDIWMDEWIHGYRDVEPDPVVADEETQGLWGYLAQRPIAVMAGQGVLMLLLLLWGQNQRFGALLRVAPPLRNSNEQYIQALADTLNMHGHTEYVLALLGQSLRDRLKSRLGLVGADVAGDGDSAIAAEWAVVTGRPASELLELLERSSVTQRLRDSELLAWVQQADTILRGLS